jgi:hypothetical protein
MQKIRILGFVWACALVVSACSGITGLPGASDKAQAALVTPTAATPTASQPILAASAAPPPAAATATTSAVIADCGLLSTHDMARLFTQNRTETQLPQPQENPVSHPVFSTVNAPGREITCILYSFINPDVKDMRLLQISYWVDIPDPAQGSLWAQAWAQLKSEGGKEIPGVGQAAYFENGRLTLQQGNVYITIEAIGPAMNAVASSGSNPQLVAEELVAQDMLDKLQ